MVAEASGWSVFEMSIRLMQKNMCVCKLFNISLCSILYCSIYYYLSAICFSISYRKHTHLLPNLQINTINTQKRKYLINSHSYTFISSIIFCLCSCKHTLTHNIYIYSSFTKQNFVRNMYPHQKKIIIHWAHLYLKFEIVRRIKSCTHARALSIYRSLFRPVNVLTLQKHNHTCRENIETKMMQERVKTR